MKKNIVILGGGSAGWITSLLVRAHYPDVNITVVSSEQIGILGAGEGTTPDMVKIFDLINVPISDLIKHCSATIKVGNKFVNWNNRLKTYFLGFTPTDYTLDSSSYENSTYVHFPHKAKLISEGKTTDSVSFTAILTNHNKVPFIHNKHNDGNPITHFRHQSGFAVHFDASKLAMYLKQIAQARSIDHIEGKYATAIQNEHGEVTSLILDDGREIHCDFVFDCSGQQSLLLGKLFKTPWTSYKKYFPQDTAIPFFISHDNKNISPYTQSIAMDAGWMWRVGIQGRYGSGYVFDSTIITPEKAHEEVERYLGHAVNPFKVFKFDAGIYETPLVKNCLAVGLSTGFIEPLEATAMWNTFMIANAFLFGDGINRTDDKAFCDWFKDYFNKFNYEILEYVQAHYITDRTDTAFWKKIKYDTPILDTLQEKIRSFQSYNIEPFMHASTSIDARTWAELAAGLGWVNIDSINKYLLAKRIGNMDARQQQLIQNINAVVSQCMTHDEFISYMKQY